MMKVSGFACAILMVLYALPLPAFHLAFNFQDMNVRRMTSAMQKIFKHSSPPAFLLGDSGSKGHLPPPPSEASLINNLGDKSNSVLVTLIAGTNETIGTKHHGLKKNIKITPLRSIRDWWKEQSKGRSGILVALLPALLVQLHMFTTAAPFVIELLTQYLNPPLALLTALALLRPINGVSFLQRTLWVSMAVGALYMMYDTFSAGASWSPLQPAEDSYAVITGSDQLLGKELSKQLYYHGYNLVLVGESADELQCLKQDILDSVPEESTVPFIQAPHRIIASLSSKLEKIPHFVSEKVENIPELQHGYDTLKKFTSNCQAKLVAQPVVQQCVQHIQTSINGSVLPVLTELKAAVNGRGQTLITQLHRTTPAITSLANQQFGAKDPIKQAPKLLQAPGASSSALPMIKDVQIVVTDWSDPCAPHKVFAEMHARGLTEKVEVLVHAADRQHVGHLAALKMSSIQSILNNNIHSAVTLTHLLLPGILKRCGSCGAGIEIDGGGGGGSSMNDHTYRPRPLAAVMSRLRKSRTPATAGVNNISKIYKLSTSEALSPEQPGGGRILFISSISSAGPSPCNSIYAASKAFLSSFAQSLRRELLPKGVMVTVANCGAIKGSFANRARRGVNTDEISADSPVVYDAQRRQGNDSARASGESTDLPEEVKPPAALPPSPQCLPPLMLMPPLLTDESTAPPSSSAPSSSLPLPPPAPQFGVYTEAEINLLSADPAEGNDKHTQAGETTNPDVLAPFIFKIPGCTMPVERVGAQIFSALRTGRDATTPGLWNKVYLHGISKVLPVPVLAALHQLAWSPAPQWSTPARWKLITPLPPIPSLPSLSSLLNLPPLASPLPFAVLPSFPPLRSGLLNFQHLPGLPPLHLNPVRAGSKLIRSSKWALNILRRDAERAMKSDNSAYVAE